MNNKKGSKDSSSWRWTNEKHLNFLSSVEATFVRRMFENKSSNHDEVPRMDRYLPDSSESTLHSILKIDKRRRHSTSSDILDPRIQTDRRTRRFLRHPYTSCQDDQVVPHLDDRRGDEDEKEQPVFPITSPAPAN